MSSLNKTQQPDSLYPEASELGKMTSYDPHYNADKLFPIPRKSKREEIGILGKPPFFGEDIWNHYEVSWLNDHGKPIVAIARISYGCETENMIESKSMKLYFNSLNNTKFNNTEAVRALVQKDLEARVGGSVFVTITPLNEINTADIVVGFNGECLDDLDIKCNVYTVNPSLLKTDGDIVNESLYSDLLKSNCLVTNQPDWGSVQITYRGKKINREGLLQYIVSFRNHNEFHEQCIERIFVDIMKHCEPEELTVYGRYTRRGGLDINPYRSTTAATPIEIHARLCRQ